MPRDFDGAALDRYITGNYGEDQWRDDDEPYACSTCGRMLDEEHPTHFNFCERCDERFECNDDGCALCADCRL